jgi:hypothetical protein
MTASLLVFVSVALMVVVSGFCFVGCVLNTHGTGVDPNKPDPDNPDPDPKPVPFTKYSGTITSRGDCIAYWPLDEASPADPAGIIKAHDAVGGHDGEYKHKTNAPGLFPCPDYTNSLTVHSAKAFGTLSLGTQTLLPGDAVQPANDPNDLTTGMEVDGACVVVPFSADLNVGVFTLEAWVRPEWDPAVKATRFVFDSRDGGGLRGFLLNANDDNEWQGVLADVNGNFTTAKNGTAMKSKIAHLVLTFDGSQAVLFVDAVAGTPVTIPAAYSANTTKRLAIGAGGPFFDDRMNSTGDAFFPLFPFNGTIQDVALYNSVLSDTDIQKHFDDGSGKTTVPAG